MASPLRNMLNRIFGYEPNFGIDPDSTDAGRLRAAQLRSISNTNPLMILGNVSCATVVFIGFYQSSVGGFLWLWISALYILGALGLVHAYKANKRSTIISASTRAYAKATKAAIISGSVWAIMPIMVYPNINADERVIIIAVMSGMMGGGVIALYTVPRAMSIWLILLTTGSLIAVLKTTSSVGSLLFSLLIVYAFALLRAGFTTANSYARNTISSFELGRQSDTIGLLLKDFSEGAGDWLWEINSTGQITIGNKQFLEALKIGFTSIMPGDYQGNFLGENNQVLNLRSVNILRAQYNNQESFHDLVVFSSSSQGNRWVSMTGKPLYDENRVFKGFRGVASDITDKKLSEERIAYLAHNDALTGLVNRENYTLALQELINNPEKDELWSIFYLDLDGFKAVNDTYGHGMGDKLLVEVAKNLKKTVQDNDVVARLGGDEFAVLCRSAGTVQSASTLAESLLKSISVPYYIEGVELEIGVSIGIALRSSDGNDESTLMNNADLALYRAKEEGRGTFRLYEHQMDEIVKERRSLETDLKSALKNNELSLAYQPLICAKQTRTVGFEALARWTHPTRGNVSPEDFIPIAESLGIIGDIGDWVINQACKEATQWPSHVIVAVNLSPQQFQSNKIMKTVQQALISSGLSPNRLELEITESLFMEDSQALLYCLREIKGMGISISLDDFGTGYSSLSYLLNFPFDKMKIDRSLVQSLGKDPNAENVLEAITKLAAVMKLTVTAEGIETLDQIKVLSKMHCTHFQGFLFGKPLNTEALKQYLSNEFGNKQELHDQQQSAQKVA